MEVPRRKRNAGQAHSAPLCNLSGNSASTVGQTPQLYCAGSARDRKHLTTMSFRTLLLIVFLAPIALLGGASVLGLTIPVPEWGRDYVLRFALEDEGAKIDLPQVEGPDDPARPLVVIDAGHGGRDPGAIGTDPEGRKVSEKDITLAIALAVRDELLRQGGIRVALTRADDRIVPLP